MTEQIAQVEYDDCGRMKYNSDLHFNQGKPWDDEEKEYLIKWYSKIGLEEMSLALGRTEGTISTKVTSLRKRGLMSKEKSERLNRDLTTRRATSYANRFFKRKINQDDVKNIMELKKTKTNMEIAKIYKVSASLIDKRVSEYKEATKNPDQSVQSSIVKQSNTLYHMDGGMQVAN